ncbi:MAG: SDR family NAD(P)-dependent oxidoreductase [Lachnospiraceae bacterium]|jgi:UDP-glucuronate 4-epimerase|nr:SDR family NAD(P)-dependent oxidoreductase [Lachnospiraceae bacterium]
MPDNNIYLITGAAGFIGYHLAKHLLAEGAAVVGFDNMNGYYDVALKEKRLALLGAEPSFTFIKGDLADKEAVLGVFARHRPHIAVNLAAQAGVRYSLENPDAYVNSNIVGFFHILEACRRYPPQHLVYASSSSVYGNSEKRPFSVADRTDEPASLYAATKKANELMADTYHHLYSIPLTGLRFFTVYGPWGRPDMAYYKFTEKILGGEPIQVYNNGDLYRDFTYIDDIIIGVRQVMASPPPPAPKIYNIGHNQPVRLDYFIETLEKLLGKTAIKEYLPMQPGDVYTTYADIDELTQDFGFRPQTGLEEGLHKFVEWYRSEHA